ncbi:DUF1958 domain-containing protein [Vagococcus bubulae]|uniref:Peptidase S11 D-alanyl-D-alanine carboxypeptidase A N-terminal domain-containing protein n=1 Tax=Vagococcus bubulae TaxID=1977868 RepID=A0A429ZGR5_9ENTE|nr:DUF1958 domain-containing protein [Vagococcus bubulae]RST92834.1 hypothetical protein CBF36_08270 [Vagococcus bubulae]
MELKKLVKGLFVGIIFFSCLVSGGNVLAQEMPSMMDLISESGFTVNEADKPKGAVLIDANTGQYLWGENPDTPHNPASIMKLMVVYLVYQAIEEGRITLDTTVEANERYVAISQIYQLSNNKIQLGVSYPVRELLKMAVVPSSNVATVMLADLVEPNAVEFLNKVNQTAQELGMTNTKIVNITGAEIGAFHGLYASEGVDTSTLEVDASNTTTARDLATFTYFLLSKYPDVLTITNSPKVTSMPGTPFEETFDTYNYSLPGLEYSYEGVDGLKTGSSPSGGFNIDMTAKKGELRLIAIVLGVGDWSDQTGEYKRHPFANAMLNYGFNHYEYKNILETGEHEIDDKIIMTDKPLYDIVKKDEPYTLSLADGNVLVDNGLEKISATIPVVKVSYKEKEEEHPVKKALKNTPVESIASNIPTTQSEWLQTVKRFWKELAIGFCSLIFLLFLIIWYIRKRNQRKRMKARVKRQSRR